MAKIIDLDPDTKENVDAVETPEAVADTAPETVVATETAEALEGEPEAPEQVTISLGEEPPKADDHAQNNSTVRQMRERIKELDRIQREKDRELAELKSKYQPANPLDVGAKPTLADADYDEDKFATKLLEWNERKRKADEVQAAQAREAEEANKAWQTAQERYTATKESLKLEDFADSEMVVDHKLSQMQRGILLQSAQSAALVYAIGRNPAELERLAAIKNPIEFAFAVRDLETGKLKVVSTGKPKPETKVVSTGPAVVADVEKRLDELREEARRTGNTEKLMAFKKAMKAGT